MVRGSELLLFNAIRHFVGRLLDAISKRYEKAACILTTNKTFE